MPLARLSAEDQAFLLKAASLPKPKGVSVPGSLAKCNGFDAFWPSAAQCSLDLKIDVISEDKSTQKFIYQSAHFQFVCNAQLRPTVIAALATVFEGTHELLRVIPLNNRLTATPTKLSVFLCDSMAAYHALGGPPNTAGVCAGSGARAVILVPLDSLGVRKAPGKDEFLVDPQTNQHGAGPRIDPCAHGGPGDGGRMLGKAIEAPPLKNFMSQTYAQYVSNPQFCYGMGTLLTYYFYHLDGRGNAARIKAYVQALQDGNPEPSAREKLLDGRTWSQLEADFTAAMAKQGIKMKFAG